MDRARVLRLVHIAFGVVLVLAALGQVVALAQAWAIRAVYPYDIEWMEGATLISALRVTEGKPLYGMPDATYIPFIYPPLYAWVVAGLSAIFPFGYTLGRCVSIAGTMASAGALVFGAREAGARWPLALACAAIFLGTWEESGSFFDLVRIDGLSMGLIGWALVLSVGAGARRAVAGGLVLAVAFMCKHHAAALGFPIAAALAYRDGWKQALRFGLAAAIPALVFVVVMQASTDGRFLLWIVEVPSHHGVVGNRFWPTIDWSPGHGASPELSGAGLEVLAATPLVWLAAVGTLAVVVVRDLREAQLGRPAGALVGALVALGAVIHGVLIAFPKLQRLGEGYAIEGLWSVIALLATVGLLALIGRAGTNLARSPRFFYWSFVAITTFLIISLMRGHVGGYTNVLMPMMWVQALWPALLARRAGQGIGGIALMALALAQIRLGQGDYSKQIPNEQDVRQGDALIAELRDLPGPILLTDAPYYAVLAGKEPSFALIALWDISDRDCPPEAGVQVIHQLLHDHYWKSAVFPDGKPGSGVELSYKRAGKLQTPGPRTFTGWPVKFKAVWEPKSADEQGELNPEAGLH